MKEILPCRHSGRLFTQHAELKQTALSLQGGLCLLSPPAPSFLWRRAGERTGRLTESSTRQLVSNSMAIKSAFFPYLAVSVLWLRELAIYRTGSGVEATGFGTGTIRCAADRWLLFSRSVWSCPECWQCGPCCCQVTKMEQIRLQISHSVRLTSRNQNHSVCKHATNQDKQKLYLPWSLLMNLTRTE